MRLVRYTYPFRALNNVQNEGTRSPWSGLETEIDRLFETAMTDFGGGSRAARHFPIDLYEDKGSTYVRAELPGVSRENINVEMVDGYLTISASRKATARADGEGEGFSFSRSLAINDAVQSEKVAAAYENGVLIVTLPKQEEAKAKKISVTVK